MICLDMIYFISECLDTSLTNIQWLGGIQLKKDPARPTYNSVPIQWKRMSIDDIIRVYKYVYTCTFEVTVYCQKIYFHMLQKHVVKCASGLFRSKCKLILFLQIMFVYFIYSAMAKTKKSNLHVTSKCY